MTQEWTLDNRLELAPNQYLEITSEAVGPEDRAPYTYHLYLVSHGESAPIAFGLPDIMEAKKAAANFFAMARTVAAGAVAVDENPDPFTTL